MSSYPPRTLASWLLRYGVEAALPVWAAMSDDAEPVSAGGQRPGHTVVAADSRGTVSAITFSPDDGGVEVPSLGVRLCRHAVPVRRGVPRVTPGRRLSVSLPVAVLRSASDSWTAAVGASARPAFLSAELATACDDSQGGWLQDLLDALAQPYRGCSALAASTHRRRTGVHRSG